MAITIALRAPIFETSPDGVTLLHLGVSARQRYNGDDGLFRYRPRPLNGRGSRWVEASGGSIRIESRPQQGTRTIILLPAAQPVANARQANKRRKAQ